MQSRDNIEYDGTRAPEFPSGLTWFNTDEPLSIKGLRGKIVLLDFWTYGCINCLHIIPDLKRLEAKYSNELVVIGVHSAKFAAESNPEHLHQAVRRYSLQHPVVSDSKLRIWSEYTVRAWPTMVLIDPAGKVVKSFQGEGHYAELDYLIEVLADKFRRENKLDERPLQTSRGSSKVEQTPLYFPGKIAVGNQIVVSDSAQNRLVVTDKIGNLIATIGSGQAGLRDGDFDNAQFSNLQGIFIEGEQIYVADTNNHAIRLVDLNVKTVRTLAGTGEQAPWLAMGGSALKSPLSSPWDVLKVEDSLYIAMAGTHQIWRLDLKESIVAPFAGSGAEGRRDGDFADAAFAQPSGLATDGKTLFVADSESSCIRAVDISGQANNVKTLAGGDLFDFGDRDGQGDSALFQHPLGLAYKDGFLYIADTYNSKIKRLDPRTGEVTTIFAEGLNEPSGLIFDGETLLIADTNSHQIKRLNLKSKSATTFEIVGLTPPNLKDITEEIESTTEAVQIWAANREIILQIAIKFPECFKLNPDAPQRLEVTLQNSADESKIAVFDSGSLKLPLKISLPAQNSGKGVIKILGFVNYCSSGNSGLCKAELINREIPFKIGFNGAENITTTLELS